MGGFSIVAALVEPVMTTFDVNKDGKVTKDEFLAIAHKFFKYVGKGNTG